MFRKQSKKVEPPQVQTAVLKFPNGTFIETDKGDFFYIKNDVRIRVPDEQVLASWRVVNVPVFAEDSLKHYPILGTMKFRDGTVIVNQADQSSDWYISGGKRRKIENPNWFKWLNINENDIIYVSREIFDIHQLGEPLS